MATTTTPTPTPKPTCTDVLKACDTALNSAHKAIEDQQQVINNLKLGLVDEKTALDKANQRTIFENPAVMLLLGAVGGIIIDSQLRK